MQEKTIQEQLNKIHQKEELTLHPLFQRKSFSWFILALSVLLMFIENFLKMDYLVGGWHIVSYLLLLTPLVYLAFKGELKNPYVKWFLPILLVLIVDMFVYSNEMVQDVVPIVYYLLLVTIYSTSMHQVHSLYQTLLPHFIVKGVGFAYISEFFDKLFVKGDDNDLYGRIGLALLITVPFLGVFVALLFSADENFADFLTNLVDFSFDFDIGYLFTVPLYLFIYLLLFIFTISTTKSRTSTKETKSFDMLIVGIFLAMINLLFLMFIMMQLPFLFGELNLPENKSLAEFAREGFFQLMMVMGIVILIFLFIMRRFKGEKLSIILLGGLLVQTILMGAVSLKKMYLYQSIKGATVLRYYVEWFDYFLIVVLSIGVVFLVKNIKFSKLLDAVAILGVLAFTSIVSLNVDSMVTSHNIEKFKDEKEKLDSRALSRLSIDALPSLKESNVGISYSNYVEPKREMCKSFSTYHLGYCSKLKIYGEK